MNPRGLILFLLAGVGVAAVFFMTRAYLNNAAQQQVSQAQPVAQVVEARVLIAKKDIAVGTLLAADDFKWQPWPKSGVSDAYYSDNKLDLKTLAGQVARLPIAAGEPIAKSALIAPGDRGFMAAVLNPGMRAVTVGVNAIAGVGGFIHPGDRVDVILTHTVVDNSFTVSETVMQNVRVLAVDQQNDANAQEARVRKTTTLEVTPRMAEEVAMLERLGTLSLALRGLVRAENEPAINPTSPPINGHSTFTFGSDVSQFLPKPDDDGPKNVVRVDRGSIASVQEFRQSGTIATPVFPRGLIVAPTTRNTGEVER